jgi:hypothetical protein
MHKIKLRVDANYIDVTVDQLMMLRHFEKVYFYSKTPPYMFMAYANETIESIGAFLQEVGDPLPVHVVFNPIGS